MNQMSCDEARLLLPLYIDDALTEKEAEEIKAHLESCKRCRKECAVLQGIMAETKNLPELEVSEQFCVSLTAAIEETAKEVEELRAEAKKSKASKPWRFTRLNAYRTSGLVVAAVVAIAAVSVLRMPKTNQFIFYSPVPYVVEETEGTEAAEPSAVSETESGAARQGRTTIQSESTPEHISDPATTTTPEMPIESNSRGPQIRRATSEDETQTAAILNDDGIDISQTAQKIKRIYTFRFNQKGLSAAKQLLAGLPQESGVYVVEASQVSSYQEKLMKKEGYQSFRLSETDLTEAYVESRNNGDTKKMEEIDFQAEHCYIKIYS